MAKSLIIQYEGCHHGGVVNDEVVTLVEEFASRLNLLLPGISSRVIYDHENENRTYVIHFAWEGKIFFTIRRNENDGERCWFRAQNRGLMYSNPFSIDSLRPFVIESLRVKLQNESARINDSFLRHIRRL